MSDATPGADAAAPPRQPVPGTFLGIHPRDVGVLGCGALAAVGSLGSYYTVAVDGAATVSTSFDAWHGFLSGLGVVLALAGSGVLAAALLGVTRSTSVRPLVLVLYLAAAASTLASYGVTPAHLCDDLVYLDGGCDGAVVGRSGGYWRTLLGTGGGAFVALYWHVVDRRVRRSRHDSPRR